MAHVLAQNRNITNISVDHGRRKTGLESYHRRKPGYVTYGEANFYIDSRYRIQAVLGKGSYGTVCSAIDTTNKKKPVQLAIKKVSQIFTKDVLLKRAVRELKLMRFFRGHRNIVNLIDLDIVYLTPYDGLYCFQELASYDLARVIHSSTQFSEFHIQSFMYQICCGVKYIHSADVMHRDLKPGNILVTPQGTLKICDFGLARGISPKFMTPNPLAITNYVATRWYRAPELLLSKKNYSKSVDMWAVGCIFAEFFGRKPLFAGKDQLDQANQILSILGTPPRDMVLRYGTRQLWDLFTHPQRRYRPVPWEHVYPHAPETALHLLSRLVCWDSNRRYTVDHAIEHPFLTPVRDYGDEPTFKEPFDFSFEARNKDMNDYKILLHDEVAAFKAEKLGKLQKESKLKSPMS